MKAQKQILEPACSAFEEDLVLYYYGEGSTGERRRVEDHINGCARCQRFVDDLRGLLPEMAKSTEMPASFWDNYYREMKEKLAVARERQPWWRSWFAPANGWLVPALGTAAMAVLAIFLVLGKGNWTWRSNSNDEPIPQEILTDTQQLEFFKSMDMLESLPKLEKMEGVKPATI